MRLLSCMMVALGAVGASAVTARAQQEAAAVPRVSPARPNPMKVILVRSNAAGCEPACAEWIAAQGQIDETTPEGFRRVLTRLGARRLPVLIDSIGGEVDASLAIGRMIRARGLDIVVSKTVLEPCIAGPIECETLLARGFETGRPEARISKCASACAFLLAGGVRRYVGAWTLVGLHEIKAISTLRLVRQHYRLERHDSSSAQGALHKRIIKEELLKVETREGPAAEGTYAKVGRYFADMGIAPAIMAIMRAAPNSTIHWMKVAELKATGLATDFINGEQFLAPAQPTSPTGTSSQSPPADAVARTVAMQPSPRTTISSSQAPPPRTTIARPAPETTDRFSAFGN